MSGFIRGMEAGYGLGDRIMSQYDEDQLRNDLRVAGDDPNAVAQVYAKHGKADKAMQMRATGLQMKGLERQERQATYEEKRRAQFEKDVQDPYDYAKKLFDSDLLGGQNMAGKRMQYQRTNGGAMAWLADEEGNPILGENGSPMARFMTDQQVRDIAFRAYMGGKNPEKLMEYERGLRKDAAEGDYRQGMLGVAQQNASTQEQWRKDQTRLLRERLGAAGAPGRQPIGMTNDGQMIVPDGRGGFSTQPIMVNGRPATPEQLLMFKKNYGLGGGKPPMSDQMNVKILEEYQSLDPSDDKMTGAFDAKYPGWRAAHGLGGDLKIRGAKPPVGLGGAQAAPAATPRWNPFGRTSLYPEGADLDVGLPVRDWKKDLKPAP